MSRTRFSLATSWAAVALAYAAATLVAFVVHGALEGEPALLALAAADLAGTLVVFGFSVALDNSSLYDPYWSVAPLLIAAALALEHGSLDVPRARQLLVVALVVVWGLRLTGNWARGWQGLEHEDWRYVDLRHKAGRAYWAVSLFGLHLMPTVCVFLGCLPLGPALASGTRTLGPLDALATLVTLGAIVIEAAADEQLRTFRLVGGEPGRILDTGLWAHCRHPNYLGEVGFWWGLFLFGLAADPGAWWTLLGAVWINALFVFISIPLIDKRSVERRPAYAEHMTRLPALLPRPWRRGGPLLP